MSHYQYEIAGYDNQILQVKLTPGQSIQSQKGAMTFMDQGVAMDSGFGSKTGLFGAFKRKFSGESIIINEFKNNSNHHSVIALSPQRPSHVIPISLTPGHPGITCRRGVYLAGSPAVAVSIIKGAWGPALFGGGQLVMQKLTGDGDVFMAGNGAIVTRRLRRNETITADLEAIIAFESTVEHRIRVLSGIKNQLFGGESITVLTATGPGIVYLQSISLFQVAEAHIKALIRNESKILSRS